MNTRGHQNALRIPAIIVELNKKNTDRKMTLELEMTHQNTLTRVSMFV
jgi:hypothetical protein